MINFFTMLINIHQKHLNSNVFFPWTKIQRNFGVNKNLKNLELFCEFLNPLCNHSYLDILHKYIV